MAEVTGSNPVSPNLCAIEPKRGVGKEFYPRSRGDREADDTSADHQRGRAPMRRTSGSEDDRFESCIAHKLL